MKQSSYYPVVGRDDEINLDKYSIEVLGRRIIDYEKLQREQPELYARILKAEQESDLMEESE
jgi:hypothetical protein